MTTRRHFLKGSAVFCSCGLLPSAHGREPARRKRPVLVGGKKIKTIDVHAHCHFHEAGALLGADAAAIQVPPLLGASEVFIDMDQRLSSTPKASQSSTSGSPAMAASAT